MARLSAVALLGAILMSAPCMALDVLVNQVGFEQNCPKVVRVQRATNYAGAGTFSVKRVSDNTVVLSGSLTRKGALWDKFYWEGDFSSFKTSGDYYVSATVSSESGNSYNFSIQDSIYLNQTGVLVYQYFNTQRCGVAVSGWHGICHADDGLRKDNLVHIDASGGWHDAGDYNKFCDGFGGDGCFDLLWLYDANRAYYDAIDTNTNGIADILDEALHQGRWIAKMVEPSGHVLARTEKRRDGASWVRPENDTDNGVGNSDDRWIDPRDESTPQEITCCAALIKMHRILASKGLPTESFRDKALAIWNHKVAVAVYEGGHNNLGNSAMHIWAGLDLYAVTGQQDCWDRSVQKVGEISSNAIANPSFYDTINFAEPPGYEMGVLAWFARNYPTNPQAANAKTAVQALMNRYKYLADDPIGLIRRDDGGTLQYFVTNPDWNAFFCGTNRLYLLLTWAGIEAYKLVPDQSYLRFAIDQYNWVMGANYNRVCMMEQAGDYNLAKYHTRYDTIPGHSSGKQPGVVPNGYVRVYSTGLPNIDLTGNRYQTNEGWVINNAAYAMAISEMSVFQDHTGPGLVTNLAAAPGLKQISLSWSNPSDTDFVGTIIRFKTTGYPTGPTDGTLLVDKPNTPGSMDSYTHTGLTSGTTYYYSAFTYDGFSNYSAAANAGAAPYATDCFREDFAYADAPLVGCDGWIGATSTKIMLDGGALKVLGGAGSADAAHTVDCGDSGTGVVSVDVKIKKGSGTYTIWNLWIDDPATKNLARWYGSGTQVRGRIAGTGSITPSRDLTGGWDDLLVKLYPAINKSQFLFNGAIIGTLDHTVTGAGDTIGRVRFESIDSSSGASQYVWFDDLKVGLADDGFTSAIRALANDIVVYLGNKSLYLKSSIPPPGGVGNLGYIEEPTRANGIQVEGTILSNEGDVVYLTGTTKTTTGGERYILLSAMSTASTGPVKPLGVNNRDLKLRNMDGLYVKTWGAVKPGTITASSYVLTDGSDSAGIEVITTTPPGVTESEFVKVEGAAGWDGGRVIYSR